jgi:hypothetical protein
MRKVTRMGTPSAVKILLSFWTRICDKESRSASARGMTLRGSYRTATTAKTLGKAFVWLVALDVPVT